MIARQKWNIGPNAPARLMLTETLAAIARAGKEPSDDFLDSYARSADELASVELEELTAQAPDLLRMADYGWPRQASSGRCSGTG